MAHLAIKGHPTRGYEVIETLEMLADKMLDMELYGNVSHYGYYINDKGYISLKHCSLLKNAIVFTLEEFLEKFPYKVGDKVVYEDKIREITNMVWEEQTNTVAYKLDDKLYCNVISELQLYKEETMEEKLMPRIDLTGYCKDKYIIALGNYKIQEENGVTYAIRKKPQYPKTYEECCEVLGIDVSRTIEHEDCPFYKDVTCYENNLLSSLSNLRKLLICRDAYWKIAGEQMGLEKPWESNPSNEEQHRYAIYNYEGTIVKNDFWLTGVNAILVFPTEEIRDAFLENFKDLIKECISLL